MPHAREPAPQSVAQIVRIMEQIAPPMLSETWDNTGLLLGDPSRTVTRLMTCLTLTGDSLQEAIDAAAEMVISHHPLPFKPLASVTTETLSGGLVWRMASHGISLYSPHTAWDSATDGINAQLARKLSLTDVEPLIPRPDGEGGAGRYGCLSKPLDLDVLTRKLCQAVPHCRPRGVAVSGPIARVAFACGSGGGFISAAAKQGCQLLVTGEATFHNCLEAQALGVALLMIGHFASEKFAMDALAARLSSAMPSLQVWSSRNERDPVGPLA